MKRFEDLRLSKVLGLIPMTGFRLESCKPLVFRNDLYASKVNPFSILDINAVVLLAEMPRYLFINALSETSFISFTPCAPRLLQAGSSGSHTDLDEQIRRIEFAN